MKLDQHFSLLEEKDKLERKVGELDRDLQKSVAAAGLIEKKAEKMQCKLEDLIFLSHVRI